MGFASSNRNSNNGLYRPQVRFYSSVFLQRQTSNKFPFNLIQPTTLKSNLNMNIYNSTSSSNYSERSILIEPFLNKKSSQFPDSGYDYEDSSTDSEVFSSVINLFNKTGLEFGHKFDAPEYAVFGAVLLLSAAIGVFYGCFGKGQKSTDEYLIADRQMSTIPAALSILCSFISSITILGNPVEIYFYGSSYGLVVLAFIPLTLSLSYLYVPVFYNLKLSSAYEYFELRFNRSVRTVISLVGIVHYIIYMSIVVYGPSLAIGQVTGISTRLSTAVIFVVCVFYSTLGGLKAVIVTDALQAIIMTGSLITIVYKGTIEIGGFGVVWDTATKYDRTNYFNFDLDPRTRHTVWTSIIGGYLQWLPAFAATHSQVQRYLSMSSLTSVRRALLLNLVGFVVIFGLCYWAGLAIFTKYHNCDPNQVGSVTRPDQLLPLFVMDSMGDYPGLPGLFVAGITCASLSSVSSGLNALSAIVTYDYLKNWMPLLGDRALLQFSKTFCIIFGAISFGFIFLAENLGNILPAAFSISGIVMGPTLGIFSLGMFVPWANSKGSLLGLLSAFFIMTTLVVGNQIAAFEKLLPDQTLPGLTTDECPSLYPNISFIDINSSVYDILTPADIRMDNLTGIEPQAQTRHFEDLGNESVLLDLFSISYMWYAGLGYFLAMFFGIIFSIMLGRCENSKGVNPNHLSPPILWLWVKLFPAHSLKWIDIETDNYPVFSSRSSNSATLSLRSTDFSFRKESVCDMKLKRISILQQRPADRQPVQPESTSSSSLNT